MEKVNAWITAAVVSLGLCAAIPLAEAAEASKGEKLFVKHRCTSCHSVKAVGIEKKAGDAEEGAAEAAKAKRKPPDLSGVGLDHDAAWFSKWLQKKETVEGRTHMKKFRGTDAELKTLTQWIASLNMDETGKPKKAAVK